MIYTYIRLVNHFRSSPFKQLVLIRLIVRVRLIFYMYLTTPLLVVTSDFRMCSMIIDNMYLEKKYVWIVSHDWIVVNDQWSIWVSSIHVFFLSLSLYALNSWRSTMALNPHFSSSHVDDDDDVDQHRSYKLNVYWWHAYILYRYVLHGEL